MKHIKIGDTRNLRQEYKIFNTPLFGILANELQNIPDHCFGKQLDIEKFFEYLKRSKGFKYSYNDMKNLLVSMSIILGFSNLLKLSKEERSDVDFQVKISNGKVDLYVFDQSEINEPVLDSDIIVRSADGSTQPAYYRLAESLTKSQTSMLKAHYAEKYGDPYKKMYENFLMARPITKGFADEHERSYTRTYTD